MSDTAKSEAETVLAKIETMFGASSDSYGSREEWERDVLPAIVGGIMAGVARGRCRDVFGRTLTPTEFHAWEALEQALQEWPGPGPEARRKDRA
jgi:hypothetical protein